MKSYKMANEILRNIVILQTFMLLADIQPRSNDVEIRKTMMVSPLTHWGWDKLGNILQTASWNDFFEWNIDILIQICRKGLKLIQLVIFLILYILIIL